jgi:MraZ protein
MLIGEYIHTMDEKKRISLPVKFRKSLGKQVVLTHGLDSCLFLFTIGEWKKIGEKLSSMSFLQSDNRSFNRYIFGSAQIVDVDNAGRILIPDHLKDRAKFDQKVVFIGVSDRVELWNETAWSDYKGNVESQADQLAEKLSHIGVL